MTPKPTDGKETADAAANNRLFTPKNESNAPATPKKAAATAGSTTPKSAPARPRANTARKSTEPPTLLADFLRGRPSPQRLAAERKRRMSLDAVKAEMRAEMRQAAVAKIQQPGGVRDRVNKWQKANAAAMAAGDPMSTPSEPTEIAFPTETESVTEEDRVRIKMRQKKQSAPKIEVHNDAAEEREEPAEDVPSGTKAPPKKRVVSDDHWMAKKNNKSPQPKKDASPNSLPKNFVQKTPIQAPMAKKIQDWAMKVEMPDPTSSRHSVSKSADSLDGSKIQAMLKELQDKQTAAAKKKADDDGIRVTPIRKKLDDDGIRVRPSEGLPKATKSRDRSCAASSRNGSDQIVVVEEDESDRIEVIEDADSHLQTPTRKPSRTRKVSHKKKPPLPASEKLSWVSSSDSAVKPGQDPSDLATTSLTSAPGAKPLEEIPFGFSAFSELDLPLERGKTKRKAAQRNPSFKAADVLKKVVSEGKKILHDAVEAPKQPVVNQPPSIEKWLNGTVDPFIDQTKEAKEESKRRLPGKKPEEQTETRKRSVQLNRKPSLPNRTELSEATDLTKNTQTTDTSQTTETTQTMDSTQTYNDLSTDISTDLSTDLSTDVIASTENDENLAPKESDDKAKEKPKTPSSAGLRRRAATRGTISPVKSVKKPFREILKEAFRGESSGHQTLPSKYISEEERCQEEYDNYDDEEELRWNERRCSSGSNRSYSDHTYSDDSFMSKDRTPTPRRKPPTNGAHELSTILGSADTYSDYESDRTSQFSETTVTQTTAFTRTTEVLRRRSTKSRGLKRRLTKHSDLVSVLSLPDDSQVPGSFRNVRSRPSVRKAANRENTITNNDLLQEFIDDENLYQRELKTLVDGVIPVLLSSVLHGDSSSVVDLFGPESPGRKAKNMSKSVVNMGVALEKLKTAHKKAPHTDINRLISWMHIASPIYDSYLDAWQLGFQDLIVNLAPAADRLDEEDSLINALPRNAEGDVVNEDGERVDVAHLLKRPLLRVRTLAKFTKGLHAVFSSYDTLALVGDYDRLQEKCKRRHKEESARLTDEDAINTDTTRIRDLRTLAPMGSIKIDPKRQVNAKDLFSLSLAHSNGQRLECQVELVHRDLPGANTDRGDLLIRETGSGRRTWLLFPPMPMTVISAHRGEGSFELVLMVQGTHNGRQWYELLNLVTDNEDQVAYWLAIVGTIPVPPKEQLPALEEDPESPTTLDVPVGGKLCDRETASPEPIAPNGAASSLYHDRSTSPRSPSTQRTPTQDSSKDQRQKPVPNTTPFREDGAPPPPIHRSLSPKSPQLQPPVDLQSPRIKRRGSSPLKHEYLPSEESSDTTESFTETSESETESEWESSEDEFEDDIPETELGFSIRDPEHAPYREIYREPESKQYRQPEPQSEPHEEPDSETESELQPLPEHLPRTFNESFAQESMFSSVCSLTPSNSASQAGLHGHKTSESHSRYIASISYWNEKKGQWKDISVDPCSIHVTAGVIEAYSLVISPGGDPDYPLLSLELTPLVLLRQSTVVDLEIRSAVKDNCKNKSIGGGNFRFRCPSSTECFNLYMAVHHARLNNQKFIQLENEARYKSFGERPSEEPEDTSSRRRSWFGRKNSYRASTRAPSQSQDDSIRSSSLSASSFLKRLTGASTFNIARSSIDKQRPFSVGSLYTSDSSSYGYPRSPSISIYSNSIRSPPSSDNIKIRLHLLVTSTKWEDYGNCILQIRRPPPGWHQELRANHGLEKRVTVTTMPKKDKPRIVLDAVLGSGCFTPMGSRGIVCGIWEELRDERGEIGVAPKTGGAGGSVKKWCFQCASVAEASWVLRLVHQEVELRD